MHVSGNPKMGAGSPTLQISWEQTNQTINMSLPRDPINISIKIDTLQGQHQLEMTPWGQSYYQSWWDHKKRPSNYTLHQMQKYIDMVAKNNTTTRAYTDLFINSGRYTPRYRNMTQEVPRTFPRPGFNRYRTRSQEVPKTFPRPAFSRSQSTSPHRRRSVLRNMPKPQKLYRQKTLVQLPQGNRKSPFPDPATLKPDEALCPGKYCTNIMKMDEDHCKQCLRNMKTWIGDYTPIRPKEVTFKTEESTNKVKTPTKTKADPDKGTGARPKVRKAPKPESEGANAKVEDPKTESNLTLPAAPAEGGAKVKISYKGLHEPQPADNPSRQELRQRLRKALKDARAKMHKTEECVEDQIVRKAFTGQEVTNAPTRALMCQPGRSSKRKRNKTYEVVLSALTSTPEENEARAMAFIKAQLDKASKN